MARDIAMIDGKPAMMHSGQIPWQGVGKRLNGPVNAREAIKEAQLDWEVKKVPIYLKPNKHYKVIANKFAVVRTDSTNLKDVVALGVVGKTYQPLQNTDAFDWFDPIVGKGEAVYHTAGALGCGEHVWILAKLPGEMRVVGDDIAEKFLLLSNSHDGSSSVRVKFAPIRTACLNTLLMPSSVGTRIRVRHNGRLHDQLSAATMNLGIINACFSAIGANFQLFAGVQMDEQRLSEYIGAIFPEPAKKDDQRAMKYVTKARGQARYLFEMGKGNNQDQVRGTLWAAYNGVTEFVDYCSSLDDPDRRLDSIWFGGGYVTKAKAYREALARVALWKN